MSLQVTNAQQWKPVEPQLLQLPSGRVVSIREVDLLNLIMAGKDDVPDFVRGLVVSRVQGVSTMRDVSSDNIDGYFELVNTIVMAGVVEPRIVPDNANYDAGQINLLDMSGDDRIWIFSVLMPVEEMQIATSFREKIESANLQLLGDKQKHGGETKRNTRSKK